MKRISLVLLLAITIMSCQNKYPDLPNGVYAEVITNKGTFVAKLYNEATPLTVANFVSLAQGTNQMVDDKYKGKKFYDSVIFHRVIKDFMIQGGDPTEQALEILDINSLMRLYQRWFMTEKESYLWQTVVLLPMVVSSL